MEYNKQEMLGRHAGLFTHPEDQYPDPPENEDFETLPEAFQDKVAERFERGAALTDCKNRVARLARERAEFHVVERQRLKAARARHIERTRQAQRRAGKASIAERLQADHEKGRVFFPTQPDARKRRGH